MIPRAFEYHVAENVGQALEFLSTHDDVKVLAGGQSLIPMMKLRVISPSYVLDISRIEELRYIREGSDGVALGALTRDRDIEKSQVLRTRFPLLVECCGLIADYQVRNLGTIGGNLAHGDPSNDFPPAVLALKAKMVISGVEGSRVVDAREFYRGTFETAVGPSELLTEVQIPSWPKGSGGAFLKLERRAGDFAIASVAVQLAMTSAERCVDVGIALGSLGPTALRADSAERELVGKRLTESVIEKAANKASSQADPTEDLRGSAEYKKAMAGVLTKRAIRLARRRAVGRKR